MKRIIVLMIALSCILNLAVPALADAELTIEKKNLITFEGDWRAYFFAKVTNTGDTGTYIDYGGKLVGFDDSVDVVFMNEYVGAFPSSVYLKPGEYAYIRDYLLEDELKTKKVVDYKYSIKPDNYGNDYDMIPCEAEMEYSSADTGNNYIYVTFTNPLDTILYGFAITVAMYDAQDELIYVNGDSTSSLGVHPGSTVTTKIYIDSDLAEYFLRNALTPTKVDALVYINKQ